VRQIGTLSKVDEARQFSDHLLTLGMTTRIEERPDGWAIWVYNEDHVAQARQELDAFQKNPDDPRYHLAETSARAIQRESQRLDQQFHKNYREMRGRWDRPNLRRRPLTFLLIVICVVVYLATRTRSHGAEVLLRLTFTSFVIDDAGQLHDRGMEGIFRGEVWRLITPIFLHGNALHILFNLWALSALGTLIEYRRGTRALLALVFLSAITSNVGQYAYLLLVHRSLEIFGGMSGVVYALFGYVWMKGRHEPEQGMILHPSSVQTMLFWLVLCMTGLVGNIANAAHVIGLVVGILFGLARF
jgi:rhomboid protease GlpG